VKVLQQPEFPDLDHSLPQDITLPDKFLVLPMSNPLPSLLRRWVQKIILFGFEKLSSASKNVP